MLTNQNGKGVEVGKQEGNCRRTGQERCPQVALERGSCLQRRKCISNAKVMGAPLLPVTKEFRCD